jgi:hypothetical protein
MHLQRFVTRLLVTCAALALGAGGAQAQDFGLRAGASVDPDQFYFGAHLDAGPLVDRVWLRPNVEVGLGDDLTLTTINFEFVYKFLPRSDWTLYGGGGPAVNFYRFDDEVGGFEATEAGFNLLFGGEHREGFLTEVKIGLADSPNLKFGVGYTWR